MMEPKLLVCVMSCQKNQSIWKDILERQPANTIIFAGGDVQEPQLTGKLLLLPCRDAYDGLPEKMIHLLTAVRRLSEFQTYTHILKHDDIDAHCSPEAYATIVAMLRKDPIDYAGQRIFSVNSPFGTYHFGKVPRDSYWYERVYRITCTDPPVSFCGGGQSYILSVGAIDKILARVRLEGISYREIYEDIMIGRTLAEAGVKPVHRMYGVQCLTYSSSHRPLGLEVFKSIKNQP